MTTHVTEWLGPYQDGELSKVQAQLVEAHLAQCCHCRAELRELVRLRALLRESAAASVALLPERFPAGVAARLPSRATQPAWQRALEIGWRLVPWVILGVWALGQAALLVSSALVTALYALPQAQALLGWLPRTHGPSWAAQFATFLGSLGLGETSRVAPVLTALVGWGWLPLANIVFLAVVVMAYWSWLASWWARHRTNVAAVPAGRGNE